MASLDNLEGGAIEGASTLVLVAVGALAIWLYLKWRGLNVSYQVYPDYAVSTIATGADYSLANSPLGGTSFQTSIDHLFGGLFGWVSSNLPSYGNSKSWADYQAQNPMGDNNASVGTYEGE